MKISPAPDIGADFYKANRERLRTLFTGTAPIVLTANGLLQRNGDSGFTFRQDSSFWYLTGIAEADIVLVMDKGKEYLIVPERVASREAFDGVLNPAQMIAASGVDEVLLAKDGWKKLESRLKRVQHVATLAAPPAYVDWYDMYTNPARSRLLERIKAVNPEIELLDLRSHLTRMRSVKQPLELAAMQHAIDVTVETISKISRRLPKYTHEYQIEADITHAFRQYNLGHGFYPVVSSGKQTCILHYDKYDQPLADARLLYMDIGADFQNWGADITRTYFLTEPSPRERAIYAAVREAHAFGLDLLKPGITPKEIEEQATQFVGEKLRALGLIKIIEKDDVRTFFTHRLSHGLGLDTHDPQEYERPLESGMVVTIEPGIYVLAEGIGVRLEDDVLITADGCKVLSGSLPIPDYS